ncbi:hypothetical protein DPEC_G00265590 [Dallia pectoralis]|uniref:Uncharacterized protein n=1 Tax=Dallia pectoralis TaxID=75939 RepID=A0ACC2FN61_DALPE|nr:hypothetical protein DPEC_G00265590 [Dallia pectoralis]
MCLTKATSASDCPERQMSQMHPMSGPREPQPRHTCPSRERWNCLHCGIAFRRDFANSVVRAGHEHSYDALVQFGNAPITNLVNLQWKRDALEKHIAERATHATVNGDRLLTEYMEKRQTRHRAQSKQQQQRKPTCTIKWKRPVCMQKKKGLERCLSEHGCSRSSSDDPENVLFYFKSSNM